MKVSSVLTKDYENDNIFRLPENKPKTNPIKPNFKSTISWVFPIWHIGLYILIIYVEANAKGRWGGTAYNFFTRGDSYMRGWRTKFILLLIVYFAVGGKQPIKMFHDGEVFIRQAVKKVVESNS